MAQSAHRNRGGRVSWRSVLIVQGLVAASFGAAWARDAERTTASVVETVTQHPAWERVPIPRETPLRVSSLYNDPELVSDAELAAVLRQVRPQFAPEHLSPNHVEHALRIWGVDATFADKNVMSGAALKDFLVNHGHYLASWGTDHKPLLIEENEGVRIRWGKLDGASVHHDHWLASLTEAGVRLDEPVYMPSHKQKTIGDVLQQALRDFQLDERETEWSAMAFGLWLPPIRSWQTQDGRELSFDLIAERLMRGTDRIGVCHGTHRVYSLALLTRLDDEYRILQPQTRSKVIAHLAHVRDLLVASQFPDGHWPSNWSEGADALANPIDDALFRKVIATGHHLEWLALVPEELHPPRENIRKAAKWAIQTTVEQPTSAILSRYTFYSHVGGAMSLWRSQRASDFWRAWEAKENDPKGI